MNFFKLIYLFGVSMHSMSFNLFKLYNNKLYKNITCIKVMSFLIKILYYIIYKLHYVIKNDMLLSKAFRFLLNIEQFTCLV